MAGEETKVAVLPPVVLQGGPVVDLLALEVSLPEHPGYRSLVRPGWGWELSIFVLLATRTPAEALVTLSWCPFGVATDTGEVVLGPAGRAISLCGWKL